MKITMRLACVLLAVIMLLVVSGCGNKDNQKPDDNNHNETTGTTEKEETLIGTWRGNDHDGEKVVRYLVLDENGYWNIYMNYTTLVSAIKQLPNQLVSFKIFTKLQNSAQTGCFYEYVKFDEGKNISDYFAKDEKGVLTLKSDTKVQYTKASEHSGEPHQDVVQEARDLFDSAREAALS